MERYIGLSEVLEPHVEELVVTGVRKSRVYNDGNHLTVAPSP